MFPQPLAQSIIHARLPSASSRFERGRHVLIETDKSVKIQRKPVRIPPYGENLAKVVSV
jgi:hypothetical protein